MESEESAGAAVAEESDAGEEALQGDYDEAPAEDGSGGDAEADTEGDGEEAESDEGEEGEEMVDTFDYKEHLPEQLDPFDIVFKARLAGDKVIAGRKKTVQVQVIIPYDSEKVRAVNDLLGEYVTLVIRRDRFKEPETELEKEAVKQYWFDFGQEVGA
jgi:hypothetical protein